jgi:hypothetical protein
MSRQELPPELRPIQSEALVPAHLDVFDVYDIGASFEALADALRNRATPYPWCYGAPTKAACIEAGHCRRTLSCGD